MLGINIARTGGMSGGHEANLRPGRYAANDPMQRVLAGFGWERRHGSPVSGGSTDDPAGTFSMPRQREKDEQGYDSAVLFEWSSRLVSEHHIPGLLPGDRVG